MSATSSLIGSYLLFKRIPVDHYQGIRDFSYIDSAFYFFQDDDIDKILQTIPLEEKALVYFSDIETCKKYASYIEHSAWFCSKNNHNYKKREMDPIYQSIVENEKFEQHVLFTTTTLDNGVNLNDDKLKHLIIDIFDIDLIIQAIGRIRNKNNNLKIYVRAYTSNNIKKIKCTKNNKM